MNTMNMPGFAAEASLYHTNNHYRLAAGGPFLSGNGITTVIPQGCGWGKTILCGAGVAFGGAVCVGICLDPLLGPAPCYVCWATALPGSLLAFCKDCIPGWMRAIIDAFESGGGDGGGGADLCCPVNQTCKCGGKCVRDPNGRLSCVGGVCLHHLQECP
jgi:hypothetical protein